MTRKQFITVFAPVMAYYEKQPDENTIELYFRSFESTDYESFKRTMTAAIKRFKFFPRISELLEITGEQTEVMKKLAWSFVMDNIHRASTLNNAIPAPAGTHETVRRLGGWHQVAQWRLDDLSFKMKDFFELFVTKEDLLLIETHADVSRLLDLKIIR